MHFKMFRKYEEQWNAFDTIYSEYLAEKISMEFKWLKYF